MTITAPTRPATLSMREAVNAALVTEMERDPSVVVIGEDVAGGAGMATYDEVGSMGGIFGVTKGLVQRFGRGRVLDTPLAESAIMGTAVGAAMAGLRPVVELMFVDFLGTCLDQIYNQGAKVRYMSGGQASVPMVIRTTYGGGISAGAQHSGCHYSVFAHFPGIKVVVPTTPADAQGLLSAAIRDDDLVVFFEHKATYADTGPALAGGEIVPLGTSVVRREGTDVTVVGIGRTVSLALEAAAMLADDGIDCEVVDLRSIVPLDRRTLEDSVNKTGRLLVVDEDSPRCSVATDLVGQLAQHCFDRLRSAPRVVTPPNSPVPFAPELEAAYQPDVAGLVTAIRRTLLESTEARRDGS